MRCASGLLALLLATPGGSPLSQLAARLGEEIVRVAGDRAIEVGVPEDRTGRGATVALDLRSLVLARLEGRLRTTDTGPRLRLVLVLSETRQSLVASGRVIEEPSGRLIDILSVSVAGDPAVLTLSPSRGELGGQSLDIAPPSRTPPVESPVLDVAFLGDDRLAVLSPEAVVVYRWESPGLVEEQRRALPGLRSTVRLPAGVILAAEGDSALWVMTNQTEGATLFAVESGKLVRRSGAAALPWPGAADGLRYRPGTNLLEGAVSGLGSGPFLTVARGNGVAILHDATVVVAAGQGPIASTVRSGPAFVRLWGTLFVASGAAPPGTRDSLVLLDTEGGRVRAQETLPLPDEGAVRAMAARPRGDRTRLVCAVEQGVERGVEQGGASTTHLLVLEIRARTLPSSGALPR